MLEQVLAGSRSPVHLTPATTDRAQAQDWFERFEGAGLDGVIAKRLDAPYQPGKRAMFKVKHQRTADCVVAGFRWHKPGEPIVGSLLLGLFDNEGVLHHVGVTSSFTMERRRALADELAPLRVDALDGHPWAAGRSGRTRWPRAASACRAPPVAGTRARPLLGAASTRTSVRGRLRPPAGRPIPARHDLPSLAPGPAAGRLSVRPARDHEPIRALPDLRRLRRCGDRTITLGPMAGCVPAWGGYTAHVRAQSSPRRDPDERPTAPGRSVAA